MQTKEKGITLIALVITIIVLLILAGITINTIMSNDGAPQKAVEAKEATEIGDAKDATMLLLTNKLHEYYEGKYIGNSIEAETIKEYLESEFSEEKNINTNGYKVVIKNGKIEVSNGNSKLAMGEVSTSGNIAWDNSSGITPIETNIKVGNNTVNLSALNKTTVAQYYGTDITTIDGVTYGLFYVDYEGKYGEAGTVYLRAKSNIGSIAPNNASITDDAINLMKKINPDWAKTDRATMNTNSLTSAERGAIHLCNENVSNWSGIKTKFIEKYGANNVNYVIGGPGIEMYIASYRDKYNVTYTTKYFGVGEKYEYPGYLCSSDNGVTYDETLTIAVTANSSDGGMYVNTSVGIWLASPLSNYEAERLACIGYNGNIGANKTEWQYGISPLVSIKPGTNLE